MTYRRTAGRHPLTRETLRGLERSGSGRGPRAGCQRLASAARKPGPARHTAFTSAVSATADPQTT